MHILIVPNLITIQRFGRFQRNKFCNNVNANYLCGLKSEALKSAFWMFIRLHFPHSQKVKKGWTYAAAMCQYWFWSFWNRETNKHRLLSKNTYGEALNNVAVSRHITINWRQKPSLTASFPFWDRFRNFSTNSLQESLDILHDQIRLFYFYKLHLLYPLHFCHSTKTKLIILVERHQIAKALCKWRILFQ